jgi:hypothetical protein
LLKRATRFSMVSGLSDCVVTAAPPGGLSNKWLA